MPLYINNVKIEEKLDINKFVENYKDMQKSCQWLLDQQESEIGPKGLVYIGQREIGAASVHDDGVAILGSEDATTCHIAVLRHTGSKATSLCHFDGSSTQQGLATMVSLVSKLTEDLSSGRLELHLVGGFLDFKNNSHSVSNDLLDCIQKSEHDVNLITACITHFNTIYKEEGVPFPVIYGIGVDVKTGKIFRARFPDKGPAIPLRSARHFTGSSENIVIYDGLTKELALQPFHYDQLRRLDMWIAQPNEIFRKYLSTSPEQEPEDFEANVRASLEQMKKFPNPLETVFKGQPLRYRKDKNTGNWIKI